jgi:nucleotide sugar dehydrogenase
VSDFQAPDRVVVGADDPVDGRRVADLYAALDTEIVHTDVASAEMIKLASNAFLATKISFVNEIANVCELVGANVSEVSRGMGLDRRIGSSFLHAGIGYGGSCFPKDVSALKQLAGNTGYHFQLLNAVIEVNELQKRRVIGKLRAHLGDLRGKRVALLGLAFKPNTDDMREASSVVLASRLRAEGVEVRAYDPVAGPNARPVPRPQRHDLRHAARGGRGRGRDRHRDRVERVPHGPRPRRTGRHGLAADHRRPQPARSQLARPQASRTSRSAVPPSTTWAWTPTRPRGRSGGRRVTSVPA